MTFEKINIGSLLHQSLVAVVVLTLSSATVGLAAEGESPRKIDYPDYPSAPLKQTRIDADAKSHGCVLGLGLT